MFDIGGIELLVIGAVALIVVGPKDLPRMVRMVGQWVGRARGLAREFQSGMEDAARSADLDDLKKLGDIREDIERDVKTADQDFRAQASAIAATTSASLSSSSRPAAPPAASGADELGQNTMGRSAQPLRDEAPEPPRPAAPTAAPRASAAHDDDHEDDEAFLARFEDGVRGGAQARRDG